jgi:hypothetical protein
VDPEALAAALADPDTAAGLRAVARAAVDGGVRAVGSPQYLRPYDAGSHRAEHLARTPDAAAAVPALPTLGVWGGGEAG